VLAARQEALLAFARLIAPFTPHLAEECWARIGGEGMVVDAPWPDYDPRLTEDAVKVLPVQVNGKRRGEISAPAGAEPADVEKIVLPIRRSPAPGRPDDPQDHCGQGPHREYRGRMSRASSPSPPSPPRPAAAAPASSRSTARRRRAEPGRDPGDAPEGRTGYLIRQHLDDAFAKNHARRRPIRWTCRSARRAIRAACASTTSPPATNTC
jgi:leucyl-tRNA synthetase